MGKSATDGLIPESDWPAEIRRLRPIYVQLLANEDEDPSSQTGTADRLWLTRGGGFGHWGLVVSANPNVAPHIDPADYYVLPFGKDSSVTFVHELQ